ncbi:MAG: glycosyltransferase family 39 protein [Candidatus Omnitrophica bacterium]|nr:glycosyltransferase family 39 protein [Candidatus Omnitrophota bacterium]
MRSQSNNIKYIIILLVLSWLFFIFGNGILSLSNPDEVFYAQTAKEMIQHNSWMTPYLFGSPQFEKPILLYWLLRSAFIISGISAFSARFFPAVFAALGVIAVYWLSLVGFRNAKKAFMSGLILMSCGFYIGMARTVFTDMIFSVLIVLSLASFFWGYTERKNKAAGILLSFIFSAMAVLAKGPLGLLIPLLSVTLFLLFRKDLRFFLSRYFLWGIFIFALISCPWYVLMIKLYGTSFINEFFYNDHLRRIIEAEHLGNDTWYFYPFSIFVSVFPWSLYVLISLVYLVRRTYPKNTPAIYHFLASWICAVLVIFQPAHSKLISYILPLVPALAIACADFIYESSLLKKSSMTIVSALNAVILFLIPLALIFIYPRFKVYFPHAATIYIFSSALSILAISMLFFIIRKKFTAVTYLTAMVIPVFLSPVPFIRSDIEPYLSSRDACRYLLKNYTVSGPILCSKPFARGVRYYTDKEVAVMNTYGKNFFSVHPVPFLDTDEKVRIFLRVNPATYCVLRKSALEDIRRAANKNFRLDILKVIGSQYIVKIEPA